MWILYDPLPWVVETSLQACSTSSAWLFDVVWLSLLGGKPSTAFTQALSSIATSAGIELILKLGPVTLNCNKCRCWVDSETWACYPQLQQAQVLSWYWNLGLLPFHSAFILRLTWRRWTLTMPAEGLVMFIDTLAALKTPLRSAIGPLCAFQLRSFGVVSFAKGCKTGING